MKLSVGGGRKSRKSLIAVIAVGSLATLGLGTTTAQAASQKAAKQPAHNVIVVLRSQHPNLKIKRGTTNSPRVRAFRSDQSPVLSQARKAGATHLRGFTTVNAIAARVTPSQAATLASDPSVAAIYPDLMVKAAPLVSSGAVTPKTSGATGSPTVESGGICPTDPSKPLLEPEALQTTNTAFSDPNTPQAQNIVDGKGVKVAFIADGVDINNPDFIRADGTHVFVDYQDFSGDGPNAVTGGAEAFGDASAIAAQGRQAYDLSNFVSPTHPLPAGCNIEIRGMAPGASLIGLKVFGNSNSAPTSRFIEAIDYAVADGADVLNESFGGNPFPDTGNDPISLADKAAVAAGVTVVASSGDAGVNGTVGSPGSADNGIISVGATTTFRSYIQTAYAGAQLSNGTWVDNNISGLSSAGITQQGRTVNLVAPGDLGWALCTPDVSTYTECTSDGGNPSPIQNFGGTSQSSPLTAGAAALVIEAYENTHHGVRPSPSVVERILTSTATDLGHPAAEQGAGELNSLKAVQAAESWRDGNGHPATTGSALVVNKSQLAASGSPGSHVSQTLSVTNVSGSSQQVTASTRTLGKTVGTVSGTTTLNTASSPTFVDSFGIVRSYAKVNFTVPSGVDRITMTAAGAGGTSGVADRIILIDPTGAYTAYSIPQGASNYAEADVRYPTAGTWTAYIAVPQSSNFNGSLQWQVLEQDFTSRGSVSPSSFTLRPGATRTVVVHTTEPSMPSDLSASVQLNGSKSGVTSVPLTLRAEVPGRNYSFSGTIYGGNGRAAGGVAQSNVYYLNVPRGRRDLGVGIQYGDSSTVVLATLTAPNGEVYSWDSNYASGSASQNYVRSPMAGRWVLSLEVLNPVSGQFTSYPFKVSVAYNTVHAYAAGLPASARTKLAAGVPVTVPVTISNRSAAPLSYFVDGRLNQTGPIQLYDVNAPDTFPLPATELPVWLVPSHVTSLTATASADQPVNMELEFYDGDPDLYSAASGNGATVTDTAPQVSPSFWLADVGQTGPFPQGAPAGTVTVTASAIGQLFDPAISTTDSDYSDYWQEAASSSASMQAVLNRLLNARSGTSSMHPQSSRPPLALPPTSTTIDVTITPTAASGTTVHGHLYIDSYDPGTGDADELVDLPYTYTVK